MKKYYILIAMLLAVLAVDAQNNQKPCSAPQSNQFDFWVGSWDLFSADTSTGTNNVFKIMDGCTVQENFENPKTNYIGKSWSVYNPRFGLWQQTWVDNQGGYIILTGKFENGQMTLLTEPKKSASGKEQVFRMIYNNITPKSFDWNWESTTDGGITWVSGWKIHYVRKP